MKLTALDLSLTATGLFHGDPEIPTDPSVRSEIATPDRRRDEPDVAWNARRYERFAGSLLVHFQTHQPELLVIEITSHAHQWHTKQRGGFPERTPTTRGQEFRAGLGLGRALGWIDGLLVTASAYGVAPARVEVVEAKVAKLRVAGAQGATKAAVRDHLHLRFGWDLDGWRESEVDALAVGLAWVRTELLLAHDARLRALAEEQGQR